MLLLIIWCLYALQSDHDQILWVLMGPLNGDTTKIESLHSLFKERVLEASDIGTLRAMTGETETT